MYVCPDVLENGSNDFDETSYLGVFRYENSIYEGLNPEKIR